jgi:thioredoxin-like negative regulator of GroEL
VPPSAKNAGPTRRSSSPPTQARPDCDVAWRAAKALLQSGGVLERATSLAEQAVALAPRNAEYRLTLAEIHLGAKRPKRAQEECAAASRLAPKDGRIATLSEAIAKQAAHPR